MDFNVHCSTLQKKEIPCFSLSLAERAWFRLAAGCAFLKICEEQGVGDKYNLEQFYTLGSLFTDPVPQVREKIILKLHKVRPYCMTFNRFALPYVFDDNRPLYT